MCKCNPSIRTPFCGKGDCVAPLQDVVVMAKQTIIEMNNMLDSDVWLRIRDDFFDQLPNECQLVIKKASGTAQSDIARLKCLAFDLFSVVNEHAFYVGLGFLYRNIVGEIEKSGDPLIWLVSKNNPTYWIQSALLSVIASRGMEFAMNGNKS